MPDPTPAEVADWDQYQAYWTQKHRETCRAEGHLTMNAWWARFGIAPSDNPIHQVCHRCGVTDAQETP